MSWQGRRGDGHNLAAPQHKAVWTNETTASEPPPAYFKLPTREKNSLKKTAEGKTNFLQGDLAQRKYFLNLKTKHT